MADGSHSEASSPPPEGGRGSSDLDRGGQFSERFLAWVGRTIRRFFAWTKRFTRECIRAWKYLDGDQRVAAVGASLLIISTFGSAFSFVEAAVVLTALGILILLKKRADGRMFHLPFGDGLIIMTGGAWAALLILIRLFDRPLGQNLLALVCAAIIVIAGLRIRVRRPIDDLPEARAAAAAGVEFVPPEASRPAPSSADTPSGVRRRRSRTQSIPAGQMALDQIPPPVEETQQLPREEDAPTRSLPRPPETDWPEPAPPARSRPAGGGATPAATPTPPPPPPPPAPPARDETASTRSLGPRTPGRDETAARPQPATPAARRASGRPDPLDNPPPRTPAPPPSDASEADPDFDFDPTPPPRPAEPPREQSGPFRARRAEPRPPDEDDTRHLP